MENLEKLEWYQKFIEDARCIIVEKLFESNWARIECYHLLGCRIIQEIGNFERENVYGEKILHGCAKSLGISERLIYYSVEFAKKHPKLDSLPGGKSVTWTKIKTELLPDSGSGERPSAVTVVECPKCHYTFDPKSVAKLKSSTEKVSLNDLRTIIEHYAAIKGVAKERLKAWSDLNFKKHLKAAKNLLIYCQGVEGAKSALDKAARHYSGGRVDWSLEGAVLKNISQFVKPDLKQEWKKKGLSPCHGSLIFKDEIEGKPRCNSCMCEC